MSNLLKLRTKGNHKEQKGIGQSIIDKYCQYYHINELYEASMTMNNTGNTHSNNPGSGKKRSVSVEDAVTDPDLHNIPTITSVNPIDNMNTNTQKNGHNVIPIKIVLGQKRCMNYCLVCFHPWYITNMTSLLSPPNTSSTISSLHSPSCPPLPSKYTLSTFDTTFFVQEITGHIIPYYQLL